MDAHSQFLQRKVSGLLQRAKETAKKVEETAKQKADWAQEVARQKKGWAQEEGTKVLGRAREVSAISSEKMSAAWNEFTGTSSSSSVPRSHDAKVASLCEMGFSEVAAKHGLRQCGGQVEDACLWLSQPENADELLAIEVQAKQVPALRAGSLARIHSVSGPWAHLNGTLVTLCSYSEDTERWTVLSADGAARALRARNLELLMQRQGAAATPARVEPQASAAAADGRRPARSSAPVSELQPRALAEAMHGLTDAELRERLAQMAGGNSGDVFAALEALSGDDLMEAVASMCCESESNAPAAASPPAAATAEATAGSLPSPPPPARATESSAAVLPSPDAVAAAVQASCAAAPPPSSDFAPPPRLPAATQAAVEAPRKAPPARLRESSPELVLQKQRLVELEMRESELLQMQVELKKEAEAKDQLVRQLQDKCAAFEAALQEQEHQRNEAFDDKSASAREELDKERLELKALQEQVTAAATELAAQKDELARASEERELRLLEEESEQLHVGNALREESERLGQQRRSVHLLKQALLGQASMSRRASEMPAGEPHELALDDTDCSEDRPTAGADSDAEDQVWDLDWSAVQAAGAMQPQQDASEAPGDGAAVGDEGSATSQEGAGAEVAAGA